MSTSQVHMYMHACTPMYVQTYVYTCMQHTIHMPKENIRSDFLTVSSQCLGNKWVAPSLTAVSTSIKEVARLRFRSQYTFSAPLTEIILSVLQQGESGHPEPIRPIY